MADRAGDPTPEEQRVEEGHRVNQELVAEIAHAIEADEHARAIALTAPLHPADQADLLQFLGDNQRQQLLTALGGRFEPEVLSYLDEDVRPKVIEQLGTKRAAHAIAELEIDDAADVLGWLDDAKQIELLQAMPLVDRRALEQALSYPEESAGRLMQRSVVAVPDFWSVGQAIDYLRASPTLPEDFYDLYIVDPRFRPVGSIPLSKVLRNARTVPLRDVRLRDLHPVAPETDQEEVGFIFRQYALTSVPVVGESGRLIGVITVDDAVEVIQQEAEEDALKLSGVQESDIFAPILRTAGKRLPWLFINMGTAIISAAVISRFEATIAQITILAALMPIVASLGGNAGTQALTVVVRALAVKDLSGVNALRVVAKEFSVGVLNGCALMLVGGLGAGLVTQSATLGVVFGVAILLNLAGSALAGVAVPLLLSRLKLDPAVSSSVFVTTVTDVVGFLAFLGLASLYLL